MRSIIPVVVLLLASCHRPDFDPSRAHEAYPYELHTTETLPVEVFRDGTTLSIVNATARSWDAATIWINQSYSAPIARLAAGQTVHMSLSSFRDNIGETFPAGGFLSTRRSMPVRLVEVQPAPGEQMIGFVAIR
ncbi:MAG: hypothetical protein QGH76_02135 [Phycisphaerales bacterium]|jgi:hypothetical protein|nr:hypothetical protein [Phycisphaerales bacterium]